MNRQRLYCITSWSVEIIQCSYRNREDQQIFMETTIVDAPEQECLGGIVTLLFQLCAMFMKSNIVLDADSKGAI